MFAIVRVLWILLSAVPLVVTANRYSRGALTAPRRSFFRAGAALVGGIAILLGLRLAIFLYVEQAWFSQLQAAGRFWTEYVTRIALAVATGGAMLAAMRAVVGHLRTRLGAASPRRGVWIVSIAAGAVLALGAGGLWEEVLLALHQSPSEIRDPAFGLRLNFYLFSLPVLDAVLRLVGTSLFFLVIGIAYITLREQQATAGEPATWPQLRPYIGLALPTLRVIAAVYLLRQALGRLLDIPMLAIRPDGAVYGASWMDVHVGMPSLLVATLVYLVAAVWVLLAGRGAGGSTSGRGKQIVVAGDTVTVSPRALILPLALVAVLILARGVAPAVVRPLVLKPNEITLEQPYIESNIRFSRRAWGLDESHLSSTGVEVGQEITPAALEGNRETLANIRLWDPRALLDNLRQQQEIRLYYQFHDVDIDRYMIDGTYTQVMLSVREMEQSALAEESNTWVSRHLKYTHGFGLVALPVHTVRPDGRPDLLVRNIPTESRVPRLDLSQPRIYYGERTVNHVYTGTTQDEFDYPSENGNTFNRYDGDGGVPIGGMVRRIAYATRFDGTQQLFSSYITGETKLLWRRDIMSRVRELAPFLRYDRDPYPVVTEDGSIVYIIDAYTTARTYPYSEHYRGELAQFDGANYVRNSVKVAVDAYDGSVDFYVMDPEDPVLSTYRSIFPGLFRSVEEMPTDLRKHIRYPTDLMTVQADLYRTYHMTDPQTFYQREDLWEFATERYRQDFQSVELYYALISFPGREQAEFVAMLPFTPANKNVIHSWMAARSDTPNYGDLTVYTFPKGVEVLGPRQIEARIDQNTEMSRSLSLWSQRGSNVIRGNLLAIPLFQERELVMLFAEPIFLQAEDASLPEIKRIALADQDRVVWSNEFDAALDLIAGERQAETVTVSSSPAAGAETGTGGSERATTSDGTGTAARRTLEEVRSYVDDFSTAVDEGSMENAGRALDRLRRLLSGEGQ